MSYDEALAERVRELLTGRPVTEKRMFGGLAFLLEGHMAVAATEGGLMVRVSRSDSEHLLTRAGVEPVSMGDRPPVRGWLLVAADAVADATALREWVERGARCAAALPPKG